MDTADFYDHVHQYSQTFQNNHRQACLQWGLYYEDNGMCYPRFSRNISDDEARIYIDYWLKQLVIPNPYSNLSQISEPVNLVALIYDYIVDNPEIIYLHDIVNGACKERVNSSLDILKNTLEQTGIFSFINDGIRFYRISPKNGWRNRINSLPNKDEIKPLLDYFESGPNESEELDEVTAFIYGNPIEYEKISAIGNIAEVLKIEAVQNIKTELTQDSEKLIKEYKIMNAAEYFHLFDIDIDKDYPLQQIYYGAPGTGKSDTIDRICKRHIHYRTTFHPDSDYASFVGCYKPTNSIIPFDDNTPLRTEEELTDLWNNSSLPYVEFSGKYHRSLKGLSSSSKTNIFINNAIIERKTTQNVVDSEIPKGIRAANEYCKSLTDSKITYDFIPQVFTKAYITAWKNPGKAVFLIIEEINRGNCAQIFGDLFQLLDRDERGFSKYESTPDTDLQSYISSRGRLSVEGILDSGGKDISQDINSGKLLKLPRNLYIWATMNTSDQSLFPIDSAFKRRWEWKYVKITEGLEKNHDGSPVYEDDGNGNQIKKKLNWALNFGEVKINNEDSYSWWKFIQKLNSIIAKMTDSADKQLGYFFCKANNNGVINADAFVSKVVFYLWNDVFKDYGFEDTQLFGYTAKDETGNDCKKSLTFPDFFDEDGNTNATVAAVFVKNIIDWQESKNN